ncbi:hypothetical protein [Pseudomonas aeruginosa]|uniref:hypothetical protein n=1 Tax=Pseudomonas aeruginosa TaxID=287 RepID=UPI0022DD71D2|nr:hypothetical protein [Pseudomonas aeruginosa]WBI22169.1 hypothetical protein PALA22_05453 [Pseudomonas aeruginosa]HCF0586730.1 hypothetical protein [Pseudomonas aeruginosa]HEP9797710.1 hypothetical protein [Pseudomonas aeruginosa]
MSNCSHEAWDFGALQCPDCGAVKGHVADADYAKLEAEAQALREEVAALRMARDDFKLERDLARQNFCDEQAANYQLQAHLKSCLDELAELRARVVVVSERDTGGSYYEEGWNACLDELARLNGLTVSEGLLRRLCEPLLSHADYLVARNELRALLSKQE